MSVGVGILRVGDQCEGHAGKIGLGGKDDKGLWLKVGLGWLQRMFHFCCSHLQCRGPGDRVSSANDSTTLELPRTHSATFPLVAFPSIHTHPPRWNRQHLNCVITVFHRASLPSRFLLYPSKKRMLTVRPLHATVLYFRFS